jgi:uncharacterized tellurite resistance protein B-like protein
MGAAPPVNPQRELDKSVMALNKLAFQCQMESRTADFNAKQEEQRAMESIRSGKFELAKVHSTNAIRQKAAAQRNAIDASRYTGIASSLSRATKNQQAVKIMTNATAAMSLPEGIATAAQTQATVDTFRLKMDDMETAINASEAAMDSINNTSTLEGEVNEMLARLIDAHNIEVGEACPSVIRELVSQKKTDSLLSSMPSVSTAL